MKPHIGILRLFNCSPLPSFSFFRSFASLLCTTDCMSQKQRRWPEDMAWHPAGNSLFAVYSADGGDSQISILNFNRTKEVSCVLIILFHT